jgi:cation diffusion facilitator family transporter
MTDLLCKVFVKNYRDTDNPRVRSAYGTLVSVVGILLNLLLFGSKFLVGTLFGSLSIVADAVNNLSDAGSQIISLISFRISAKPADREHPFGHARIEYVASMIVSFLILLVGVEVGKGAIDKILHPTPVEFSVVAIIGLLMSIAVKLWMGGFNRKLGKKINSAAMEATAVDSISDAISTAATMISVIAAAFTELPVDGVIGLIVAVLILKAGWGAAQDTLSPLLGQKADPELVKDIEELNARRDAIRAKVKVAKTQEKINEMTSSLDDSQASLEAFERMEEKADRMLDKANAMAELNAAENVDVEELASKYEAPTAPEVEDELAALKAKLGK